MADHNHLEARLAVCNGSVLYLPYSLFVFDADAYIYRYDLPYLNDKGIDTADSGILHIKHTSTVYVITEGGLWEKEQI